MDKMRYHEIKLKSIAMIFFDRFAIILFSGKVKTDFYRVMSINLKCVCKLSDCINLQPFRSLMKRCTFGCKHKTSLVSLGLNLYVHTYGCRGLTPLSSVRLHGNQV